MTEKEAANTCAICQEKTHSVTMTWFYTEDDLVKKPLCPHCIDNNEVKDGFWGATDMFTGDRAFKLASAAIREFMLDGRIDKDTESAIRAELINRFTPTVAEERVALNE